MFPKGKVGIAKDISDTINSNPSIPVILLNLLIRQYSFIQIEMHCPVDAQGSKDLTSFHFPSILLLLLFFNMIFHTVLALS
jgi:hypothetical protein